MRISIPAACLVALLVPAVSDAQPPAVERSRLSQRIEFGQTRNHQGHDKYPAGGYRIVGDIDRAGIFRMEGGAFASLGAGFDGGVEIRVPLSARAAWLLRAGAGILLEDGYLGPFHRFGGGFQWRFGERSALLVTTQRGGHDGRSYGPHLLMAGIERRFGR